MNLLRGAQRVLPLVYLVMACAVVFGYHPPPESVAVAAFLGASLGLDLMADRRD